MLWHLRLEGSQIESDLAALPAVLAECNAFDHPNATAFKHYLEVRRNASTGHKDYLDIPRNSSVRSVDVPWLSGNVNK